MLALDLFNTRFEKNLQEGALDDTITRTQAHLMEPLSLRAAECRNELLRLNQQLKNTPFDDRSKRNQIVDKMDDLEKEYADLVDKRMKILKGEITSQEECMGYGGLGEDVYDTYTNTYSPEAIALGKRFCEHYNITDDDDIQFAVEIIDNELEGFKHSNQPVDLKRIKSSVADAFRQAFRGIRTDGPNFRKHFKEAGLPDIADKQAKMARLTQPNKAGTDVATAQQRVNPNPNKGVVDHAVDWFRGKGGPGKEGPTYESELDEGQYDIPNQYLYVLEQIRDAFEEGKPYANITLPNNEIVPITRPAMFNLLASLGKMERKQIKKLMVRYFNDKHSLMTLLSSNLIKRFVTPPVPKPVTEPGQGNLPLNDPNKVAMEARNQKKKSEEPDLSGTTARDATVQRELQKVRARHPSARTDIEALVKDEIVNQERVDQALSQQQAELKQQTAQTDQLARVNQQQDSKINSLQQQLAQAVRNLQQPSATTAPAATPVKTTPQPSVTIAPTVSATAPTKIPEPVTAKDQEIYDKVRDLEAELKSKIDAMASWNAIAQKDPQSNNELEALRKEVERTRTELGQQVKKLKKQTKKTAKQIAKMPQATARDMGTVRQVPTVPQLGQTPTDDQELGTQISQRAQANKRTKYSPRRSATQAVPAGTAGNQQDLFGQLSSYGLDAEELRDQSTDYGDLTNLSKKINLRKGSPITVDAEPATAPEEEEAVSEGTMNPADIGSGKQLSRTPDIRRLKQVKDYELMLKKELANRIQDRDAEDDEQDFQDISESNMKRLLSDLDDMSDADFLKLYKRPKQYWRNQMTAKPVASKNIMDLDDDDLDQARTKPTFDRTGRMVRAKPANTQQGMRRMLGKPKTTRPAPALEPVEVTMQVPNRKTDQYDLLPARIFNNEAEAREFARRVNGHITSIRPVMHEADNESTPAKLYTGEELDLLVAHLAQQMGMSPAQIRQRYVKPMLAKGQIKIVPNKSVHEATVGGSGLVGLQNHYAVYKKENGRVTKVKDTNKSGGPMNSLQAQTYVNSMIKNNPQRYNHDNVWHAPADIDLDEDWKSKLAGAALAGATALGAPAAHAGTVQAGALQQAMKQQVALSTQRPQAPQALTSTDDPSGERVKNEVGQRVKVNRTVNGDQLGEIITSLTGPNARGEYLVTTTTSDNDRDNLKQYVTKTPPAEMMKIQPQVKEAANPAQQAAIAINMKKHHKKPKHVDEHGGGVNAMGSYIAWRKNANRERGITKEDAIPGKMVTQGFVVEYDPATQTVVISKRGQELDRFRFKGVPNLISFQRTIAKRVKDLEDDLYGADGEAGAVSLSRMKVPGRGYGFQELGEESSTSSDEAESAILKRIMVAHLDLLKEFGPQKVMQAVEEVAYNIGDLDEIGSSDVSGWVHQVKDILGVPEELDEKWTAKYKRSIDCSHPKGFSQRAHCAGRKKK